MRKQPAALLGRRWSRCNPRTVHSPDGETGSRDLRDTLDWRKLGNGGITIRSTGAAGRAVSEVSVVRRGPVNGDVMLLWNADSVTNLEDEIRTSSDLAGYTANRLGLPSLETFIKFVAQRLCDNDGEDPTTASIRVEREAKHNFKIDGEVTVSAAAKPIQGRIIWLPKLACFRGHVTIDPEGRVNEMLVDDAHAIRSVPWQKTKWHGDDHDHCRLCMATLSDWGTDATFDTGYTAENCGWLCPNCYNDVVVAGGEHPWLKPKKDAT